MKRYIVILFAVILTSTILPLQIIAQDKTVTLVVSGEASTKDEAIKQALRSAIEQAFGTFVSANTTVVNDQIIRDEIISVTTGNIQSYKEIATAQKNDGTYCTSVEAVVSIGKLQTFAQNKGMSTELAGATFAYNMKLRRLNAENERKAIYNVQNLDMFYIYKNGLFDYSIDIAEPQVYQDNIYAINATVYFHANKNTIAFIDVFQKTLLALSLNENEQKEYEKNNIPYYSFSGVHSNDIDKTKFASYFLNTIEMAIFLKNASQQEVAEFAQKRGCYKPIVLRNSDNRWQLNTLWAMATRDFVVTDNLGLKAFPIKYDMIGASIRFDEMTVDAQKTFFFSKYWQVDELNNKTYFYNVFMGSNPHKGNYYVDCDKEKIFRCKVLEPITPVDVMANAGCMIGGNNYIGFSYYMDEFPIVKLTNIKEGQKLYRFKFQIRYTEEEISKLSSINIEPTQ